MLRYLTPRWPYNIQGPQTLAVAQISLTNYKQRDGGWSVGGGSPSQKLPSPLPWPPPLQSELTETDTLSPLAADLYFSSRLLLYTFIKSTFRDGNSVGALHKCLFQKQSCSSCVHLSLSSGFSFFFLFLSFSFFPFLLLFFFLDRVAYIVHISQNT